MTKITRATTRETAAQYRGDPLVIELMPKILIIRRKGKVGGVPLSYEAAYELALRLEARRRP
jgi:hypothetical protein